MLSILAGRRIAQRSAAVGPIERVMRKVGPPSRMDAALRAAPRLIYVATENWYFLSHDLPMARAALRGRHRGSRRRRCDRRRCGPTAGKISGLLVPIELSAGTRL